MPRYGFNFQWMFVWEDGHSPAEPDEAALDFMARFGFDFVRVPLDYRFWTTNFDYLHPDERVFAWIDRYLQACQQRNLHLSLNIHRAPGYCINANHLERHNLWLDTVAQDGFVFLWETFARRYKGISNDAISFDLINEPPDIGEYGMTRENHAAVIRKTVNAIRAIDPSRAIVIDGLAGGNFAMPELADLGVQQSGRGYQPMPVSHYRAEWWSDSKGLPEPVYPGTKWYGHTWNRDTLRAFYQPWRELEQKGVSVHIGECGCYNQTPNDVALRWFTDLFGLYKEFGWGFALWNFIGAFGIAEHGRPGTRYENFYGYRIDRALLDVIMASRIERNPS